MSGSWQNQSLNEDALWGNLCILVTFLSLNKKKKKRKKRVGWLVLIEILCAHCGLHSLFCFTTIVLIIVLLEALWEQHYFSKEGQLGASFRKTCIHWLLFMIMFSSVAWGFSFQLTVPGFLILKLGGLFKLFSLALAVLGVAS